MAKNMTKEKIAIELQNNYWDQTFAWGKKFAKANKIRSKDILTAIKNIRSPK